MFRESLAHDPSPLKQTVHCLLFPDASEAIDPGKHPHPAVTPKESVIKNVSGPNTQSPTQPGAPRNFAQGTERNKRGSTQVSSHRDQVINARRALAAASILLLVAVGCSRTDRDAKQGEPGAGKRRAVIQNKGSDTLVNVAQAWAENYKDINPDVAIAVTGGGSGTGISSLINGTVDIANSSRKIKSKELKLAQANGVEPVELIVGYDALAVFLHPNNPIDSISTTTLAGIYGEEGAIEKWSQIGITIPGCPSDEIVRVSRQNNSGTYVYFKNAVLGKRRDYKLGSRDMHGSKDVVDLVQNTPCAIGYSGLAYKTDQVKVPCVSKEEGSSCVTPTVATAIDQSYPIARPLFMYTSGAPTGRVKQYIDWLMSRDGQCIIKKKGYAPVIKIDCSE